MSTAKRAAIYLRTSTDQQTVENQRLELERVASQRGWRIVATYQDQGVSGSKGRDRRPALDALMRDATKGKFDLVMGWAIDRIGRSVLHVANFMAEMDSLGIGQFYMQQAIDTTTPAGRAMVSMCAVFAQFEREMIVERVRAGIARARTQGKRLGRPPVSEATRELALAARRQGHSFRQIAASLHIGASTVAKITASDG